MTNTIHASCRCGAVRFQSTSGPVLQLVCHCADCRDASGDPQTNLVFFRARDSTLEGATVERCYTADSGHRTVRTLCAACGQMVTDRTEGFPKVVGVVAERLGPGFDFRPAHHVWTESRLPGTVLPQDLPCFAQGSA
jgi:hypothetical protein